MAMELTIPVITLPAVAALIFKVAIYAYTRMVCVTRNRETRLFFLVLLSLVAQNLVEIVIFYRVNLGNTVPEFEGRLYFVAAIATVTVLFQLSTLLALGHEHPLRRTLAAIVYPCATGLAALVFTPWLIGGFEIFDYRIGHSITRIPGPLYFLFELFVVALFSGLIGACAYGWKHQTTDSRRKKNLLLLIAILPTVLLALTVVGLLHFDIKWFNATATLPVAITYFLVVSAYGIHHRRFLDIDGGLEELAALRAQLEEERATLRARDPVPNGSSLAKSLAAQVAELEARVIAETLAHHAGNQAATAARLGLRPNTLHYKMERYGLPRRRQRSDSN
jgi:hypothetical protein